MPDTNPDVLLRGQERSIEHLQELYTVIAAVSVALAGEQFAKAVPSDHWLPVTPLVLGFIVTLIPFCHGTLLHLDKVYRTDRGRAVDDYLRLLVDYGFLLAQACLLVLAAIYVRQTRAFAISLATLLVVDVAWTRVVQRFFPTTIQDPVTDDWGRINLVCLPVMAALAGATWSGIPVKVVAAGIFALACARTAADYRRNASFYRGADSVPAQP